MMANPKESNLAMHYQTFLVSCWQEQDETTGKISWRFRLEIPRTGDQYLFRSLRDVMSMIESEMNGPFDAN